MEDDKPEEEQEEEQAIASFATENILNRSRQSTIFRSLSFDLTFVLKHSIENFANIMTG